MQDPFNTFIGALHRFLRNKTSDCTYMCISFFIVIYLQIFGYILFAKSIKLYGHMFTDRQMVILHYENTIL
jgi:hypothetical protein